MEWAVYAVVALVGGYLAYRASQVPKIKPPLLDESNGPTAEEGRLLPVFYGTVWQTDPNVTSWWGATLNTQTRDRVKYRTYYITWHLEMSQGPNDALLEIRVDDKTAWSGEESESGTFEISAPELFGGEDREGGIVGEVDLMMGEAAQGQNARIVAEFGNLMPAFRGVAGLVFEGEYAVNSPVPKLWATRWRRIYNGWAGESTPGDACWYPEKAEVLDIETSGYYWVAQTPINIGRSSISDSECPEYGAYSYGSCQLITGLAINDYFDVEVTGGYALGNGGSPPGAYTWTIRHIIGQFDSSNSIVGSWATVYPDLKYDEATALAYYASQNPARYYVTDPNVTQAGICINDPSSNDDNIGSFQATVTVYKYQYVEYSSGDMNPAHIIYDARTNGYRGVGYPVAMIDDAAMRAAADTYYDEGFGLSGKWNRQDRTSEWIRIINEHTDSVERISPTTGYYSIKPLRDDYGSDTLLTFDESNIISVDDFSAKGYGDLVSRITVRYTHPDTGRPAITPPWDNPATRNAQGRRVEDTVEYPLIRNHALAMRVAARDGKKRSHELRAFTLTVNREGYGLQKGDVVSVTWPKLGMAGVIVRILAINYGSLRNRQIKLGVVEDVYGIPDSTYIAPATSVWEAPDFTAEPVAVQTALEVPYWCLAEALGPSDAAALDAGAGYGMALGVQPTGLSSGYDLWGRVDAGSYAEVLTDQVFAPTDTATSAIDQDDTTIAVDGVGLANLEVGDLLQIGTGATAEIVRLTTEYTAGAIVVSRGHLDTTPQSHALGVRLWYLPESGYLQDDTEYADGDVVDYKLLTRTPQDVLDIGDATATSVTMDSRQVRPIAPGKVTINSEAWPTLLDGTLTVEWEHRDRLSHADTTTQSVTGITTEAGVTYNAYAYDDDTDTLLDSDTGISGTSWTPTIVATYTLRIEIEAERDGYVSWQRQVRTFDYLSSSAQLDADGDYVLDADGEILQEA